MGRYGNAAQAAGMAGWCLTLWAGGLGLGRGLEGALAFQFQVSSSSSSSSSSPLPPPSSFSVGLAARQSQLLGMRKRRPLSNPLLLMSVDDELPPSAGEGAAQPPPDLPPQGTGERADGGEGGELEEDAYWSSLFSAGAGWGGDVSMADAFTAPLVEKMELRLPGEGAGSPAICSGPAWMSVQLALGFMALPCDVIASPDEEAPILIMGSESYLDPEEVLAVLESRYVLSDIVQTVAGTLAPIRRVREAFMMLMMAETAKEVGLARKEIAIQLSKIEFRLSRRKGAGTFVEGQDVTLGDFELASTLYHMRVALAHFRNWSLPTKFEQLTRYSAEMHDMQVFKNIAVSPEAIIQRYERMGVKIEA